MTSKTMTPVYSKSVSDVASAINKAAATSKIAVAAVNYMPKTAKAGSGTERYPKPKAAAGLPAWFKEIREGSDFMPAKVKPVSYNYMALVESPNRTDVYAAPGDSRLDVGTRYHKPSEDVGTGVKRNFTIWQDIKNLGGKVLGHSMNLLGRIGDVLSRPAYAMRNLLLDTYQDHYMVPNSAGGTDVTASEHVRAWLGSMTPVGMLIGALQDSGRGALAAGLSGRVKTGIGDIIKQTEPEFAEAHKKWTTGLGFAGDFIVDPITFATMGANPGSISRLGVAGLKAAKLDKAGALSTLQNTVFTKAGRANSAELMRSDALRRKANQLLRKQRAAARRGNRAAAGKWGRKADAVKAQMYRDKADAFRKEVLTFDKDLKGAKLAALIARQNLNPLTALNTISRYNTGAKKVATAVQNTKTVAQVMDAFHLAVVDRLKDEDRWITAYEHMKGRDIEYNHGRDPAPYKVDLAERDYESWLLRVVQESVPVAKISEDGVKAARARRTKIGITEARSHSFITKFNQTAGDDVLSAIHGGPVKKGSKLPPHAKHFRDATPDEMNSPHIPKFTEDEWEAASPSTVLKKADEGIKAGRKAGDKNKVKRVIVVDDAGRGRLIDAEAATAHLRRTQRAAVSRMHAVSAASSRSPQRRAVDALSGVDDELAARRAQFENHFNNVADMMMAPADGAAIRNFVNKVKDIISNKELDEIRAILMDKSLSLEEQIAKIVGNENLSDRVVETALKDFMDVSIRNGKVLISQTRGTTEQNLARLPEVVRQVILDRFEERIVQTGLYTDAQGNTLPSGVLKAGNVEIKNGEILVNGRPVGKQSPNFQRDINAEIALALTDGIRSGLEYAVQMDLLRNNTEAVFAQLWGPMNEVVAGLTADMRAQVIQLMYNLTGTRLPENFRPTIGKIEDAIYGPARELTGDPEDAMFDMAYGTADDIPAQKRFDFLKDNGDPVADQERTWASLFYEMQTWPQKLFGNLITLRGNGRNGYDVGNIWHQIGNMANQDLDELSEANALQVMEAADDVNQLTALLNRVSIDGELAAMVNGISTESPIRYTALDFLMHHDEILKGQQTTLKTTHTKADAATGSSNAITRVNVGRLSALDSFGWVDDETKAGLEAIKRLKGRAQKGDKYAQSALANLFMDHNGQSWLSYMDETHKAQNPRNGVSINLQTLGAHMTLKEGALSTSSSGFGPKFAGQLMEHLWDTESLVHEWQKALHNTIMGKTLVVGDSPEVVAKAIAHRLDEHFINHDRIKRLLHPVVEEDRELAGDIAGAMQSKMANENEVIPATKDKPALDEFEPGDVLEHPRTMEVNQFDNTPTPTGSAPTGSAPATPPEPDIKAKSMQDPADFVNTSANNVKFTAAEQDKIRDWIAAEYIENPPAEVMAAVTDLTNALTGDLYLAQLQMVEHLSGMAIKHGASIRFAGIPLIGIGNPATASHAMAGVTALAEMRSRATGFWLNLLSKSDPNLVDNRAASARKFFTKQSNLLDTGINQIYTTTVNAVAASRQRLVEHVNAVSMALHDGEYTFGPMRGLSRQERINKANARIFDPQSYRRGSTAFDDFDLADGSNPVKTILADMEANHDRIFRPDGRVLDPKSEEWAVAFRRFNTYLPDQFKLKGPELERALTLSRDGSVPHPPFTGQWWSQITSHPHMQATRWNNNHFKEVNLIHLHMASEDAALRIREGRELNRGAWKEFGSPMTPEAAADYNRMTDQLKPGPDGKPIRSKLIPLSEVSAKTGIANYHVPKDMFVNAEGVPMYVAEDFLPQLKTLFEFMEDSSKLNDTLDTKMLHKVLGYFKQSVTIYKVPTYPIRNMMSDVFMSAMDGVTNPRYYRDAVRVMQNKHPLSEPIDRTDFSDVLNQQVLRRELARNMTDPNYRPVDPAIGAPETTLHLRGIDGTKYNLNDHQIWQLYSELGLGMNRVSSEIKEAVAGARMTKAGRGMGKTHDKLRDLNDWREDWGRMSHFLYALEQEAGLGGDLMDIARRAGNRVIKHHFDYNDVSLFGKRVMAQWIPFYKWIRNIIPYTIASVVTKPYMLKADQAITKVAGAAMDDNADDPRTDFVVPEYIQNDNPVDIGWYSDPNGNKFMQWMSVSLPLSETISGTIEPMLGPLVNPSGGDIKTRAANAGAGAWRVGLSSLNPIASGGIQAATGTQVWPNGPADVKSPTTWIETMASAIPGYPMLTSLQKELEGLSKNSNNQDMNQMGQLLDSLGFVRVQNNSESSQLGELHRVEDMNRAQRNQLTGTIKNKLAKKYPQLTPDQVDTVVEGYLKQLREIQKSGQQLPEPVK